MNQLNSKSLKNILFQSIDAIYMLKETFLAKPETNFSRVQKISFRDTMLCPMVLQKESTSVEMLDFFMHSEMPSSPALNYRRNQIDPVAFQKLFYHFTSQVLGKKLFKGMRLIACDGSEIKTPYNPKDKLTFTQSDSDKKGYNKVHLNTCYDILNDCYIDAIIQNPGDKNEIQALCQMMDRYSWDPSTLFIADRGYFSYNAIAHAIHNDYKYLFRVKSTAAKTIFKNHKNLIDLASFDITDTVTIGRKRIKELKSQKNYHYIPKDRNYDYISPESYDTETLKIRLLKFPISESTTEYIVTNLSEDEFSLEEIKELYSLRWKIETSFRFLKNVESLSRIHSIKHSFIHQEIFAKLTFSNFCAIVYQNQEVEESKKITKHRYVLDKTYLINTCIKLIKGKIEEIEPLISKKKVPVRAGRQYKRK